MKQKLYSLQIKKSILSIGILFSLSNLNAQTNVYTDVIATSPDHTSLKAALIQAGLDDDLQDPAGTFTVFAPTNAAFDALATNLNTNIAGLLALPNLSDILLYHVLGATVPSSGVTNGAIVTPLFNGNTLKLTKKVSNGAVYVNQAQVTTADLTTDNGVVHVTNGVVLPFETVVDIAIDNNFTSLTAAVVKAELLPALTNPFDTVTVFAPTNAAFDALATNLNTDIAGLLALPNLSDILLYHVLGDKVPASAVTNGTIVTPLFNGNTLKLTKKVSNGTVYVNHAQVSTADLNAGNGVVHVLNNVVLPFETVVDIAIDNNFTSLTAAVVKAELLPALTNPFDTVTVFAPTNAAFDALATNLNTNIAGLLALPNLSDILLYHVLGDKVPASAVTNGAIVTPLFNGNTLKLTKKVSNGAVFVNHAQVSTADLNAGNGVVHVLNNVVLPFETVVDIAIDNNFTTLTAAIVKAELLPALTNPFDTVTVFAPTNTAFSNLATALGTDLNGILALPNLSDILLYHVVGNKLNAANLTNGNLAMLNGSNTIVNLTSGVKINNSNVTTADLNAGNGVVHVIDAVLLATFLSVDEAEGLLNIEVYPNPSQDFINVLGANGKSFEIVDLNGKTVLNGELANKAIDIQSLNAGSYLIKIVGQSKVYNQRFIKM